jgi:hypothetical protein
MGIMVVLSWVLGLCGFMGHANILETHAVPIFRAEVTKLGSGGLIEGLINKG